MHGIFFVFTTFVTGGRTRPPCNGMFVPALFPLLCVPCLRTQKQAADSLSAFTGLRECGTAGNKNSAAPLFALLCVACLQNPTNRPLAGELPFKTPLFTVGAPAWLPELPVTHAWLRLFAGAPPGPRSSLTWAALGGPSRGRRHSTPQPGPRPRDVQTGIRHGPGGPAPAVPLVLSAAAVASSDFVCLVRVSFTWCWSRGPRPGVRRTSSADEGEPPRPCPGRHSCFIRRAGAAPSSARESLAPGSPARVATPLHSPDPVLETFRQVSVMGPVGARAGGSSRTERGSCGEQRLWLAWSVFHAGPEGPDQGFVAPRPQTRENIPGPAPD